MNVKEVLHNIIYKQLEWIIGNISAGKDVAGDRLSVIRRKKEMLGARHAEIVKCDAHVSALRELTVGRRKEVDYTAHFQYLIKQNKLLYLEEEKLNRRLIFESGKLISDIPIETEKAPESTEPLERETAKGKGKGGLIPFKYNRLAAVKYAEAWWNGRNPQYMNFQDNCTNFVSQCLHAGEVPMVGYPNVRQGWWQQNRKWSWSWAVAHSFQWYLSGSGSGLRAKQVERPEDLLLGDVIAYDFENDGRWNHTTIVTAKDNNGMPLVNAHSADSRRRYWTYEDSSKYTPQMKYKFFHILDNV
ncbi:MAG: amidase domain-containing protein [Ectobacillus sp.]